MYAVPLSMSLLGFGMGTIFANFHMCVIMPMCFRCLMFSLLGPCEVLLSLCFIASWT